MPSSIIPAPRSYKALPGQFELKASSRILAGAFEGSLDLAWNLASMLWPATGFRIPVVKSSATPRLGDIALRQEPSRKALGREGYVLELGKAALLTAAGNEGLFRGVQSFRQCLPGQIEKKNRVFGQRWIAQACRIEDQPAYAWRGLMLDCSRHFISLDGLKRAVDLMALHKMNVLHLHLTDDQGWRMEIKRYPLLTSKGAWRGKGKPYGGFYTQEEMRDLVAYAARQYVTIVPEIEMPGHAMAALACYPQLSCKGKPFEVPDRFGIMRDVYCAGNDATFEFLQGVLTEVMQVFPSTHIHIGGDECPKDHWKECPKCQARIRREGLKDENELQSYFIRRMEKFLQSQGRQIIGWDEICEGGLSGQSIVHWWKNLPHAHMAAAAGHGVIASPHEQVYLDHTNRSTPWEKLLAFRPAPAGLKPGQEAFFMGGEAPVWTEYVSEYELDRQSYPRLCAFAEALWTAPRSTGVADFKLRLDAHQARLRTLGVEYHDLGAKLGSWDIPARSKAGKSYEWDITSSMKQGGAFQINVSADETDEIVLDSLTVLANGKMYQDIKFEGHQQEHFWTPGKHNTLSALIYMPFRNYGIRYQVRVALRCLDKKGGKGSVFFKEIALRTKEA